MAKTTRSRLTEVRVRTATADDAKHGRQLFDGLGSNGLYLHVTPGREITYELTKVDDETFSGHGSDGCSWTVVKGYGPSLKWNECSGSSGTHTIRSLFGKIGL